MPQPTPLSPMLAQYLVGLCCLRWGANAVDVVLGDLVLDKAAGKRRDVDVTVTVNSGEKDSFAFMAYEVKHESAPLDVIQVEQLAMKLKDMKSITHRAIVSASGYTEAARRKARKHRVALFELLPWNRPLEEQFPALHMRGTISQCFPSSSYLLCWPQHKFSLSALTAPGPFTVNDSDPIFDLKGRPHKKAKTFADAKELLLLKSTAILFPQEPAQTVFNTFPIPVAGPGGQPGTGPAWPHTHTLDIQDEGLHIAIGDARFRLDRVTISGFLQWQRDERPALYYVIQDCETHAALAGALITLGMREGEMRALVFSPASREISFHAVQLADKQLRFIQKLSLSRAHSSA